MYICICNEVTDKAIIQAAKNGASTVRDLQESLNVASHCGRCATCARDLLQETLATKLHLCLQAA